MDIKRWEDALQSLPLYIEGQHSPAAHYEVDMTIKERQLKALITTRDTLMERYDKGTTTHTWLKSNCPLCEVFSDNCKDCPFQQYADGWDSGCLIFAVEHYGEGSQLNTRIEEALGVIEQMIEYWEEG